MSVHTLHHHFTPTSRTHPPHAPLGRVRIITPSTRAIAPEWIIHIQSTASRAHRASHTPRVCTHTAIARTVIVFTAVAALIARCASAACDMKPDECGRAQ